MIPIHAGNLNVPAGATGNTLSIMQCIGWHVSKASVWYTTKESWKEDNFLNLYKTSECLGGKLNTTIL
jgi:hypothetical protein